MAIKIGLGKKGGVYPTRYSEAANAYMSALEIEYKIKSEALQASFLNDVAQVLRKKITDRDLLREIAQELRQVLEKYKQRRLPEPRKEDAGT